MCIPVYIHGDEGTCHVHICKSEYNLQELATYFHYVGFQGGTQVIRLDGRCLYPMGHLAGLAIWLLHFICKHKPHLRGYFRPEGLSLHSENLGRRTEM